MKVPRRASSITQASITRVLRAYRSQGLKVRVLLMPDGSTAFEPVEDCDQKVLVSPIEGDREIVL
jgi:hypothetical protein